jgi:hypothetical protein
VLMGEETNMHQPGVGFFCFSFFVAVLGTHGRQAGNMQKEDRAVLGLEGGCILEGP